MYLFQRRTTTRHMIPGQRPISGSSHSMIRMNNNIVAWTTSLKIPSISSIRRRIGVLATSFLLVCGVCLGGLPMMPSQPPMANAASTTTTARTERWLDQTSPTLDAMIDKYIRQHMFDDDVSMLDPITGTYREAFDDTTTGRYPTALREIVTDTLRDTKLDPLLPSSSSSLSLQNGGTRVPSFDVGSLLTRTISLLQKRIGLSEMGATIVLALGFVLAGPSLFLFAGMMVGGISKRNMDQVFKKRYGDTYTVDATIKQEPTVEAPPDEDDGDDDDDDDDDEEADEDDNNKRKK
jgi:hypothetical protein